MYTIYSVDYLRLYAYAMERLSIIWNTVFRWVVGVRRFEHNIMRNKLKQYGTISFKFLIDMKFLLFLHNLKCCNTTSLLLHGLAYWSDSSSEVMKLFHKFWALVYHLW